jgi:hypothetical protein
MSEENMKRQENGRWPKGASGNPNGRPIGSRNQAALIVEALLDGEAPQLGRKLVELGLKGDPAALRLCLERIAPPRKDRLIEFDLPVCEKAEDLPKAYQSVLQAVSTARISPSEGRLMMEMLEFQKRALEANDTALSLPSFLR